MGNFIVFEYYSKTECWLCVRKPSDQGAFDLVKILVPVSAIREMDTSVDTFLSLLDNRILD